MSITTVFPKGAEWRKWDLHVHTPDSLIHHFDGADSKTKWDDYITDLEALPAEFKVIGINDYLFIDGYKRILEYREQGRLQNINTILPVVEFRIKKFAGHKDFKRVNFHVIFSDKLSPETIQAQFLNGLIGNYKLSPGLSGVQWNGIITPDSLADLGRSIKASVSAQQLVNYGTDLEEGFNNLNLDEEYILTLLKTNTYLRDNFLTAIGKTEWESLSWNDQSIAEKKDIINKVDFVFISSENVEACQKAKTKLKEQLVNHLLLDCSDAHFNANQNKQKDRIGKCFTWIKGDPTFDGLRQIKYEPETRILIQDEHPEEKTAYNVIDKVKFIVSQTDTHFNNKAIDLNPNLNVIIGGKSSGKSLLLFHIAKTIDPIQVTEKLTIVKEKEYDLLGKIPEFDFAVRWKDGTVNKFSEGDDKKNRQITYIPQMYINHLAEQEGERKLAELIESILYQNIEFKQFHDTQSKIIQDLNLKTSNDINELFTIKNNYQNANKEYREVGDKKAIEENIGKVKREITALNESAGFTTEEASAYAKLQKQKERVTISKGKVEHYNERMSEYLNVLSDLKEETNRSIELTPSSWYEISDPIAILYIETNITEDKKVIESSFNQLISKYAKLSLGLTAAIATKDANIEIIRNSLTRFSAKITNQQLLLRLTKELADDEAKIKVMEEKEKQLQQIKELGRQLKNDIMDGIDELFKHYEGILHQIQKPELSRVGTGLSLEARLEIDKTSFQNSFCGLIDGRSNFRTLFGESFDENNNYDYSQVNHIKNIKSIFDKIWSADANLIKYRSGYNTQDAVIQLLKDNYKFSYNIKFNGDDILQMSPGKRGLVLLQIILHLSNAKHPILIDQPEDNLDNRTIFNDLNEFIKEKKIQRQILLVTHNANLVVSTDAEEIIVANQNGQDKGKENEKYQFEYITGSLENTFKDADGIGILNQMGIREHVCDILEGGEAAFVYRERKYGFKN
jgi:hypothetical protein